MLPEPSGRHVFVPEYAVRGATAAWNTITSEAIHRSAGDGGAVLNDVLTEKDPGDYLKDAINGAVSGAGGPYCWCARPLMRNTEHWSCS